MDILNKDLEQKNLQNESGENTSDDGVDYISAINELKAKSVSREQYEKLKKENQKLLNSVINGTEIEKPTQNEQPSIDELRKELFSKEAIDKGMPNLEFAIKSLQLRDAVIAEGGIDPFLPVGKGVDITREDIEAAELTAQVLKECIEYADGDSSVFTNELMRRTVDNVVSKPANRYNRR